MVASLALGLIALGLLGQSMEPLVLSVFTAVILAAAAAIEFALSRSSDMTHSAE